MIAYFHPGNLDLNSIIFAPFKSLRISENTGWSYVGHNKAKFKLKILLKPGVSPRFRILL